MKVEQLMRAGFLLGTMVFSTYAQEPASLPLLSSDTICKLGRCEESSVQECRDQQTAASPLMMFGEGNIDFRGKTVSSASRRSLTKEISSLEHSSHRSGLEMPSEQDPSEETLSSTETILNRGYLKITPVEFQAVVGEHENFWSWHSSIMNALRKYHELQSAEEKKVLLATLEEITRTSLNSHTALLRQEQKRSLMNIAQSNQYYERMMACNLLLRGIEVERATLNGMELSPDDVSAPTPREGIVFRSATLEDYQSNFASGAMSEVSFLKDARFPGKYFIFKEEHPQKQLSEVTAFQLGFSKDFSERFGVTRKMANLAGRAVATYKISELLHSSLVPRTGFAVLGEKGMAKFGCYQEFIKGTQLYHEKEEIMTEQEVARYIKDPEDWQKVLIQMALGGTAPNEWRLCFPSFLEQVSLDKPLLEGGIPINEKRAAELVAQNSLYVTHKVLDEVSSEIDFTDPYLQQSMANVHLLHLLTGELDPNPLNLIYVKNSEFHWSVFVIDSELSFPSYFTRLDAEYLAYLRSDKLASYIKNLPSLIDETMGEAILCLTPQQLEETLQGTGLTIKEVEAAQSRLNQLQAHIRKIKSETGLVHLASLAKSSGQNYGVIWGRQTYEISKKEPEASYLGWTLSARNIKRAVLQKETTRYAFRASGEDSAEEEENDGQRSFHSLSLNVHSFHNKGLPVRSYSAESMNTELTGDTHHTTQTLRTFFNAAEVFLASRLSYIEPYLQIRNNGMTLLSQGFDYLKNQFFQPISEEMAYRLFQTNGDLIEVCQREKGAQEALRAAQAALSRSLNLEQKKKFWEHAIIKLKRAEESFVSAIKSYNQEELLGLLPERQAQFEQVKRKKELCSIKLRWAQLHRSETAAALSWLNESEEKASLSSQQDLMERVIHAQQAWRDLMGFLESDFESPSLEWHQLWTSNFELAKKVQQATPFFYQWLHAAQERHNTITADFITNRIQHNHQECKIWEELRQDIRKLQQDIMPDPSAVESDVSFNIARYLLEEVDLQRLYALAQQAALETSRLREEVRTLASLPLIETSTYEVEECFHKELSIVSAKYDQIKKLCDVWRNLKTQRNTEIESLSNVAISCYNFAKNSYKNDRYAHALKGKRNFLMTIMQIRPDYQAVFDEQEWPFIKQDHGLYEQVRKRLLKAHEDAHWKPGFPCLRLERWKQLSGGEEDESYYVLHTHDEVMPMKILVQEILEGKHESLIPDRFDLHEMIGEVYKNSSLDDHSSMATGSVLARVFPDDTTISTDQQSLF